LSRHGAAEGVQLRARRQPRSPLARLGRAYLIYGAVVGGPLLLLLLIGTQAARSLGEMAAAPLVGILMPAPMLVVGVALERGRDSRLGVWLAFTAPVLMAAAYFTASRWPQPTRATPLRTAFEYSLFTGQEFFLPGAAALALLVALVAWRAARIPAEPPRR
jgi:hypothetical protein